MNFIFIQMKICEFKYNCVFYLNILSYLELFIIFLLKLLDVKYKKKNKPKQNICH